MPPDVEVDCRFDLASCPMVHALHLCCVLLALHSARLDFNGAGSAERSGPQPTSDVGETIDHPQRLWVRGAQSRPARWRFCTKKKSKSRKRSDPTPQLGSTKPAALLTLGPVSSTTPDKSEPSVSGRGGLTLLLPSRMSASHGPTPEAATLIRSSPAAGAGRGTSSTTTTSGAPKRWIRAAFMFKPSLIVQETDPSRSLGLLRACGERPCDGRAAQEYDEFAPTAQRPS
jgi:hypothetical protein